MCRQLHENDGEAVGVRVRAVHQARAELEHDLEQRNQPPLALGELLLVERSGHVAEPETGRHGGDEAGKEGTRAPRQEPAELAERTDQQVGRKDVVCLLTGRVTGDHQLSASGTGSVNVLVAEPRQHAGVQPRHKAGELAPARDLGG